MARPRSAASCSAASSPGSSAFQVGHALALTIGARGQVGLVGHAGRPVRWRRRGARSRPGSGCRRPRSCVRRWRRADGTGLASAWRASADALVGGGQSIGGAGHRGPGHLGPLTSLVEGGSGGTRASGTHPPARGAEAVPARRDHHRVRMGQRHVQCCGPAAVHHGRRAHQRIQQGRRPPGSGRASRSPAARGRRTGRPTVGAGRADRCADEGQHRARERRRRPAPGGTAGPRRRRPPRWRPGRHRPRPRRPTPSRGRWR